FVDPGGVRLRVMTSTEEHRLPVAPGSCIDKISWFPDETKLLLTGDIGNRGKSSLWTLSIFGGSPQALIDHANLGPLSSDGALIAFERSHKEIWVMNAQGGQAHRIITAPGTDRVAQPMPLPNGQGIFFGRWNTPGPGFATAESSDLDGKRVRVYFRIPEF